MKNILKLVSWIVFSFFFYIHSVSAQCPVCIITVGGGLIIAEKLGIDPLLISIWISGLNTAIAYWMSGKFKNKKLDKPFLWSIVFYILTFIYLQMTKQISGIDKFLGIDKTLFGLTLGLIVFNFANILNLYLKNKNNNKVYFPYQKVVIPVSLLLLITLIFKLLI